MLMVTVEPIGILVTLKEKKPYGKMRFALGVAPQGVVAAAVRLVMEPLLVVKVTIPAPVAEFTCWVG